MSKPSASQILEQGKAQGEAPPPKSQTKVALFKERLDLMTPELAKALPKNSISAERFARLAFTTVRTNPDLLNCTQESLLGALMVSAQLGLEPNTPMGQAYIIPYNSNSGKIAQFQLGYKGLITLARRTGEFARIEARVVHENDEFKVEYGLDHSLIHKPLLDGDRGPVKGYYSIYSLKDGGQSFEYMSKSDIDTFKKNFVKAKKGPWFDDNTHDSMALKTVLKKVLKYAPISTEYMNHLTMDDVAALYRSDAKEAEDCLDVEYDIRPGDEE